MSRLLLHLKHQGIQVSEHEVMVVIEVVVVIAIEVIEVLVILIEVIGLVSCGGCLSIETKTWEY